MDNIDRNMSLDWQSAITKIQLNAITMGDFLEAQPLHIYVCLSARMRLVTYTYEDDIRFASSWPYSVLVMLERGEHL